jgi:hypothetical protein
MNVKELREMIANLPDDTEVIAHAGDCEYFELRKEYLFHPSSSREDGEEYPTTLTLAGGQPVTLDFDIDNRTDESWKVWGIQ